MTYRAVDCHNMMEGTAFKAEELKIQTRFQIPRPNVYCVPLGRGESAAGVARWPGQGPGEAQARPGAGNRAGGDREPGSVS